MKKRFKIFIAIANVLSIAIAGFSLYKSSKLRNIADREEITKGHWKELYTASTKRLTLISGTFDERKGANSIEHLIANNQNNRSQFMNECSIQFLKLEHDVNEAYLTHKVSISPEAVKTIHLNELHLNKLVADYNESVRDYNRYISVFPNLMFARSDYKKKKYFKLVYGQHNPDPVKAANEVPQWMKDIEAKHGM